MSHCARCGKIFECGMSDAGASSPCWCTALPPLPAESLGRDSTGCYCPDCLQRLLQESDRSPMDSGAS
jgi:hypothetical protein